MVQFVSNANDLLLQQLHGNSCTAPAGTTTPEVTTQATVTTTQTEGTTSSSKYTENEVCCRLSTMLFCNLTEHFVSKMHYLNNCTAIRVQPQQERPHPRLPHKPRLVQQLKRRAPPARVRVSI